jgi:hypothetical protein
MGNLISAHLIEIVWHRELACHKSEAPRLARYWSIQRNHLDQRLTSLRDNKWLTVSRFLNEAGKMGFGLVNIDGLHKVSS